MSHRNVLQYEAKIRAKCLRTTRWVEHIRFTLEIKEWQRGRGAPREHISCKDGKGANAERQILIFLCCITHKLNGLKQDLFVSSQFCGFPEFFAEGLMRFKSRYWLGCIVIWSLGVLFRLMWLLQNSVPCIRRIEALILLLAVNWGPLVAVSATEMLCHVAPLALENFSHVYSVMLWISAFRRPVSLRA